VLNAGVGRKVYLAVHNGLGRVYISDLECGRKEACLRTIEILALGFDMSVREFFRGVH